MKVKVEISNEKDREMRTEIERLMNRNELQLAKEQAAFRQQVNIIVRKDSILRTYQVTKNGFYENFRSTT